MADGEFRIDQYTVIGDIAAGQVSDVFEVMEDVTGNRFALKMIREEIVGNSTQKHEKVILSQFKQEFKLGEAFEHPSLIHVHDFKMNVQTLLPVKDPIAYFTMDYFRSQNVNTSMATDLPGTQRRLQRLLEQVCEALGYIHSKGWVHRDIKPDNLLMTKSAEARVIDLSLAMKINKRSRIIQGTRTYIAPETIKKQKAVPQTDIYSLGITVYEILTGQVPFTGTSPNELLKRHIASKPTPPSELNNNITPELDRLVAKMLSKKPADRHESMEDLLNDVRNTRFFIEEIEESESAEDNPEEDHKSLVKTLDSRADDKRSRTFKENPELAKKWEAERQAEKSNRSEKRGATVNDKSKTPQPSTPATPTPPQPTAAPQPMPVAPMPVAPMPGMPMPGMPMPGMPMPGMPMPGMPMPGMPMPGAMPGMPMPGMPMPGAMPGAAMPGMPMPGAMPGAAMPGMPMPGAPMPGAVMPGMPMPGAPIPMPGTPMPPAAMPVVPIPEPAAPGQPDGGEDTSSAPQQPTTQTPAEPPVPPAAPIPSDDDLPLMEDLPDIE